MVKKDIIVSIRQIRIQKERRGDMNNQPIKYYCETCNEENDTKIRQEKREFVVKDETVKVVIETRYCCECGQPVWDEEIEERNEKIVFDAYRKIKHFLSPTEIKTIREAIGISQAAFSRLLGFGEKTITRYESGAPQDAAHNLLIKYMRDKKNVQIAFEANYALLKPRERTQIQAYIDAPTFVETLQLPQNARSLQPRRSLVMSIAYKDLWRGSKYYG